VIPVFEINQEVGLMATNVITVKDVQEKSRDGSSWLELTDQENRTHRIFRRVQDNEGNWHDLSGKYEMLRNSENHTLRLTTEQKGRFVNVLDVEQVERTPSPETGSRQPESAARQTAEQKEAECRLKTFTTAYAKDLAVAGKIPTDTILGWAELFYRYIQGEVDISEEEINGAVNRAKAVEEPEAARTTGTRKPAAGRSLEGVAR
jgi:hypothetical protein